MPASDLWPILRLYARLMPSTLRPKPERERSNLRRARIDLDAVDVVLDNQLRGIVQERRLVRIGLAERLQIGATAGLGVQAAGTVSLLPLPCLAIDLQE